MTDLLDISVEEILPHLIANNLVSATDVQYINDKSQPAVDRKNHLVYHVILRLSEADIEIFLDCLLKCHTRVHEQLYEKITSKR